MGYNDPIHRDSMEKFGYTFKKRSECKDCGRAIEWWTTKKGKSVCFHPAATPGSLMECHWDFCPARNAQGSRAHTIPSPTPDRMQSLVEGFKVSNHARIVLVITTEGWHVALQEEIVREDVKQELLSAVHELYRQMGVR